MIQQESEWLPKAIRGDNEAFTILVESYQSPVYNLCYRMLGDANEAEDAAQETFLRAYKNMRRYDYQRAFSTWILSIAAHYCIDQIRRRRFISLSFDDNPDMEPPDVGPGPETLAMLSEDQRKVQGLLAALQPPDRAAVVMRYWYDFSYEEIAEALSTTIPAVKSRLHRARVELANRWTEQTKTGVALERKQHGEAKSPAF